MRTTQEKYTLEQFPQFTADIFRYLESLEKKFLPQTEPQNIHDRCRLSDAQEITGLNKSTLYKLTASGEIPVKRFGRKLIFSRKELAQWVENKTVSDNMQTDAVLELAKSANKKRA